MLAFYIALLNQKSMVSPTMNYLELRGIAWKDAAMPVIYYRKEQAMFSFGKKEVLNSWTVAATRI